MTPASSTPSIRVCESHHYPLPQHHAQHHDHYNHRSSSPRSSPSPSLAISMAIPRAREAVPPPLPPPRHVGVRDDQDPGWQWGNTSSGGNRLATVKPGSSLLGGAPSNSQRRPRDPSLDYISRHGCEPSLSRSHDDMSSENSVEHTSDEDHALQSRLPPRNHRFTSERQLGQKALQNSSHAYDKQLLSKIGGPNAPTRSTAPSLSTNVQDPPSASDPHSSLPLHRHPQLKPLSVPDRRHRRIDSPAHKWPPSGAISPGYNGFRSPVLDANSLESHRARFGSISTPGPPDEVNRPHRGSYDHSIFSDHEFGMEEHALRELNINDRSPADPDDYPLGPRGSLKRRASSPPSEAARDDRPTAEGGTDLYHRRSQQMLINRNCTASRFQSTTASISSSSSIGLRTGSIGSSIGFSTTASSLTSFVSDPRLSPNALSSLGETDSGPVSPYVTSRSLEPSPRGSVSRPSQSRSVPDAKQAQVSTMSTDSPSQSRHNSIANRIPGAYICECCPKKPKKFDCEEELRLHELEKQYMCQYCPNRFKNKNEAERHQNSLHLRRHSWSCATLAGVHAAFHASPNCPAAFDVCGYCGEEFPNPANWDARLEHLNHVHKFGECNQAKKFFRADHFRQHLKHSHAGTSGKWTNMLENACMRDEPLPTPLERVGSISSVACSLSRSYPSQSDSIKNAYNIS